MIVGAWCCFRVWCVYCFFQAEDGIRDLVRSRGLGDVYKRQVDVLASEDDYGPVTHSVWRVNGHGIQDLPARPDFCLLYTSDAADERSSVDLGGRRIIKKITLHIHTTHIHHFQHTVSLNSDCRVHHHEPHHTTPTAY